ncbi:unnamed protein product [Amoebophrya sp. A120]|nr:unnamed protein product [Amoebophrya sp. A120]|eukprot:GSA120T00017948001.1
MMKSSGGCTLKVPERHPSSQASQAKPKCTLMVPARQPHRNPQSANFLTVILGLILCVTFPTTSTTTHSSTSNTNFGPARLTVYAVQVRSFWPDHEQREDTGPAAQPGAVSEAAASAPSRTTSGRGASSLRRREDIIQTVATPPGALLAPRSHVSDHEDLVPITSSQQPRMKEDSCAVCSFRRQGTNRAEEESASGGFPEDKSVHRQESSSSAKADPRVVAPKPLIPNQEHTKVLEPFEQTSSAHRSIATPAYDQKRNFFSDVEGAGAGTGTAGLGVGAAADSRSSGPSLPPLVFMGHNYRGEQQGGRNLPHVRADIFATNSTTASGPRAATSAPGGGSKIHPGRAGTEPPTIASAPPPRANTKHDETSGRPVLFRGAAPAKSGDSTSYRDDDNWNQHNLTPYSRPSSSFRVGSCGEGGSFASVGGGKGLTKADTFAGLPKNEGGDVDHPRLQQGACSSSTSTSRQQYDLQQEEPTDRAPLTSGGGPFVVFGRGISPGQKSASSSSSAVYLPEQHQTQTASAEPRPATYGRSAPAHQDEEQAAKLRMQMQGSSSRSSPDDDLRNASSDDLGRETDAQECSFPLESSTSHVRQKHKAAQEPAAPDAGSSSPCGNTVREAWLPSADASAATEHIKHHQNQQEHHRAPGVEHRRKNRHDEKKGKSSSRKEGCGCGRRSKGGLLSSRRFWQIFASSAAAAQTVFFGVVCVLEKSHRDEITAATEQHNSEQHKRTSRLERSFKAMPHGDEEQEHGDGDSSDVEHPYSAGTSTLPPPALMGVHRHCGPLQRYG